MNPSLSFFIGFITIISKLYSQDFTRGVIGARDVWVAQ